MKKITHAYQNFNIDKFLSAIKNFKEETTREFVIDVIISSIDGYNKSGDDEIYFEMYLEQLVKTGEFFFKLKKYFTITNFFENSIYEDGYWNVAFVLFSNKDNTYRLFNIAYERSGNDVIYLLDLLTNTKNTKPDDKYFKKILDAHTKKIWGTLYPEKSWEELCQEFDSPNYTKKKKSQNSICYGIKYYKEYYKEGMELDHIE